MRRQKTPPSCLPQRRSAKWWSLRTWPRYIRLGVNDQGRLHPNTVRRQRNAMLWCLHNYTQHHSRWAPPAGRMRRPHGRRLTEREISAFYSLCLTDQALWDGNSVFLFKHRFYLKQAFFKQGLAVSTSVRMETPIRPRICAWTTSNS